LVDLYKDKPLAFKYLEKKFKLEVLKKIFFDRDSKTIITSSASANSGLFKLHSNLF
jgi:hypothetical protein